jgi:hypothetical protein
MHPYTHINTSYTHTYTHKYVHTYILTYTHTHTHTHKYVHTYMHTYTHKYIIHIYIHTCTYIRTHIMHLGIWDCSSMQIFRVLRWLCSSTGFRVSETVVCCQWVTFWIKILLLSSEFTLKKEVTCSCVSSASDGKFTKHYTPYDQYITIECVHFYKEIRHIRVYLRTWRTSQSVPY